jgi:hypothetical protein
MGNNMTKVKRINFEDMQTAYTSNNFIIINTLDATNQNCLIKNTILPAKEVELLNSYLTTDREVNIIIYGVNHCDESIYNKYEQLNKLGFYNVYVYSGGLFEWLLLQEIYGKDEFPTTSELLDILKYKGNPYFGIKLLKH